jgi:hypothetical protein
MYINYYLVSVDRDVNLILLHLNIKKNGFIISSGVKIWERSDFPRVYFIWVFQVDVITRVFGEFSFSEFEVK